MRSIGKFLDYSDHGLVAICVVLLVIMFVLGVATVVFRFVLEIPLAFPDELIRYLFVWTVALGSAVGLRRNAHAAIGVFVDRLAGTKRRLVLLAASALSGVFFALVLVKGIHLTARVVPQISPALEISMAWVYAAIPAGAGFMLLYVIEHFVKQLTAPAHQLDAPRA